jgi:CheY-specific phosphatase CheX
MAGVLTSPSVDTFPPQISAAVRDATVEFFRSTCGLKCEELAQPNYESSGNEIMSTISFVGNPSWVFSLVLPADTAVIVAKKFAGFDIPLESPDMGDVVGEVVNVIAGGICARLDAKGIKAQMSLPTVARGANLSLLVPSGAATSRMGFTDANGTLWVQLVKDQGGTAMGRRPGT